MQKIDTLDFIGKLAKDIYLFCGIIIFRKELVERIFELFHGKDVVSVEFIKTELKKY